MQDTDWMPDTGPPDWTAEIRVRYDSEDPSKTLSLEMAEWILQKESPQSGAFASKAAGVQGDCLQRRSDEG